MNHRCIFAQARNLWVAVVILFSAVSTWAWEGSGTEDAPYLIKTTDDLDELATQVNAGSDYEGKHFKVDNDITYTYTNTAEENNYTAIGTEGHRFKGMFNGNNKTISGIRIYKPNDVELGLFGALGEGAEVENVKLAYVEITGYVNIGGIAGYNEGTISNCTVEANVKIKSLGDYNQSYGGIVGFNEGGTVSGCTSSATLTSSSDFSDSFGGIVGSGYQGTISNNFAKNVTISATRSNGVVLGAFDDSEITNNFYTACTVAGVKNATNVGLGGGETPRDITDNNGAVGVFAVSLREGFSITSPENPTYTDKDQNKYYKPGETLSLEVVFAGEIKSATFIMPNKDVDISFNSSELHTVNVPEGFAINPYITIGGVNYWKTGKIYSLTITKVNYFIDEIAGVPATIASDKKSATFTMPSEDVTIIASIDKKWGEEDGRDGSEEKPYTIASTFELDLLASVVNSGNDCAGKYFEVVDNITYTYAGSEQENNYTAIGTDDHQFKGNFNGNGKTIGGIRIYKPDDGYQGLFGNLGEGAEVQNVILDDVEITSATITGGIAAENYKGTISNCTVGKNVKIMSLRNGAHYGGIVGVNNGGTVFGCISFATLTTSENYSYGYGGIVGVNNGGTVSGCISSATLTSSGDDGNNYGGIVGYNNDKGTISNNIAKNVTVSAAHYYGAVVGQAYYGSKLSNNFYYACTVGGVGNVSNVGVGVYYSSLSDVAANNGAVGVSFTEPTANENLVYNKSSQELVTAGVVTAGETSFGSLLYSLDGENYSEDLPTATNAGTYTVYYKVTGGSNWNVVDAQTVEVTIGPAPLTISGVGANDKRYDGTTSATVAGTAMISGVLGDDDVGVENGTAVFTNANVGKRIAVAFSGFTLSGADKDNYYLSSQPSNDTACITMAPLTVTANAKTIAYGDDPANDGVEYSGFVNGETANVLGGALSYSYNYTKSDAVGAYTITPSGLTAGNYEITFVDGTLTVEPKIILASGAVRVLKDQNGKHAEIDGNFGGSVDAPNTDAVNITESIEVDRVSFNREFTTSGYSTVVFPFNVNTSQLSGVDSVIQFAYMVYDENANLKGVGMRVAWSFDRGIDVDLQANTPYMVRMKDGENKLIISDGVTLVPTTPAVKQSEASDGWEFRGTYEFKQWSKGDGEVCRVYGYAAGSNDKVSSGDFVKFTAGARLRPLRAYMINTNMTCPTAQPAAQNAPQLARANGDNVVRASMKSAGEELPEYMNVVILGDNEERTTIIGRINTRTGEFTSIGSSKCFDIKGRSVRGKPSARGAYYKRNFKK